MPTTADYVRTTLSTPPECGYVEGVSPCNFVCEICDAPEVTTAPEADAQDGTGGEPEPLPASNFSPFALNGEHNCNGISDWQAWESDNSLPTSTGNWYLTKPVTLEENCNITAGEVKLCLNGQTVNCGEAYSVSVSSGASLTVYDCSQGEVGTIKGENFNFISVEGRFTLESGNIVHDGEYSVAIGATNADVTINGGTVEALGAGFGMGITAVNSTVTVTGGVIKGGNSSEQDYGINFKGGTLSISGKPTIKGGTADIYLSDGDKITIDMPLTATDISIKMDTSGVFATGTFAKQSVGCFTSADPKYAVRATSDNQLELVEAHTHDDGTIFDTKWDKSDSLPTEPGDYYLTQNVTLGNIWQPSGDVSICLNGHTIDCGGNYIDVKPGGSLTVYDCEDGEGITGNGSQTVNVDGGEFTLESGIVNGSAYVIEANNNSTVTISGGELNGYYGGIESKGEVIIRGGQITNRQGGWNAYPVHMEEGHLTLSGNPVFQSKNSADIYLTAGTLTVDGELTGENKYRIGMEISEPRAFADGAFAAQSAEKFTSSNPDYGVFVIGDELWFAPADAHVHEDDGTIFLPWDKEDSLPDSQGNWYLTQPVNLTGGWNVPGDVNLCLNGQTVNCGENQVTVGSGSSLTVYDDLGKKGEITGSGNQTVYVHGGTFTLKSGKIFNDNSNWNAIGVDNSGTAMIEGGTVEATGQAIYGASASTINVTDGEIKGGSGSLIYAIQTYDTLEISGGNITSAEDKAVRITSDDSNFNLSGSPVIDGIRLDGRAVITIDKPLLGKYVVYGAENYIFAQGLRAAEAKGCFELPQDLQDKGYVIVAVENGLKATILHTHGDGTEFEALDHKSGFPDKAGNYFLAEMGGRLEDTWVVPEGETTLCLNGNMIMSMGGSIEIPKNATLIICDCSRHSSGGIIFENAACINVSGKLILKSGTIMNGLSGKAINIGSSGSLIIEDGTVNGEAYAIYGESGSNIIINNGDISGDQGPAISTAGNLTVSGGSMTGNIYYGVDVTGELTLAGDPMITISTQGTLTSADIHVTNPINIDNRVNRSYSVYMVGAPCVFAKGKGAAESVNSFTSADENSEVQKVGSELWLVPKGAHVHEDDGTVFLPWDSTDSLPTAAGNYYLKNDVKIEIFGNNWTVQGDTKLCLDGHKITFDSLKSAEVPADASLTVYDCNGAGSIVGGALHCINNVEGTFTLEGGTIESAGSGEAINVGNGNIVINGGTVNGDVSSDYSGSSITITGGQINGQVTAFGNLNISGGTITSSYTAVSAMSSFTLSGKPTIKGGEGVDISLSSPYSPPITINEKLGGGPYSIEAIAAKYNLSESCIIAKGTGAAASIDCFTLSETLKNKGYEIAAVNDTLVARLKTYTITYDPGEGDDISGNSFTETKTHGTDITISSEKFTRPGYTQIGWSTEQGANEVKYAFGANYADNENLTLYPVWEKNEIHFYKGAEEIESLSLKVGEIAEISASITPNSAVCDPVKWTAEAGISIDPDTGETITVTGNSVGEFELTASTDDGLTTKSLTVTVSRSDSTVSAEDQTVTYGDEVTITATVKKAASSGISLMANYDNKVTFKLGDNELGTADVVSDTATLTISATRAKGFKIGDNTVTLEYSGNGALNPIDGSVTVTVNRKTLTATITGTTTKTYDGTASADDLGLELKLTGVVSGDTVGASAEFAYDSADVGKRTISAANAKLNGEHAGYYELSTLIPTVSGTISPLAVELVWTGDEFAYNGEPHTVTATVKNAVVGDEIKLTYSENTATNVGNYTAEVTDLGNANYTLDGATGIEHKWKITALSLANAQVEIVGTYTYNGKDQTPEIRVTLGGKELSAGDYTATYSGEVKNANTYTVTLTGAGNYSGSASAEFEIAPKSLTASISGTLNKVYDGKADVNDDVKIALTGVVESDVVTATAEISYDSENVGTRKIVAKNIELSGEDAKNYTLSSNKAEVSGSIAPAPITLPDSSFIYGGGNKTVIQVSGIGETVTATLTAFSGNAGEYKYSEAAKESSYTVELSSENYSVSKAGTLTIKPLMAVLEWQGGEFTYDGTVHEVKATVKNAVTGDIFNITYAENTATNAGDYTAKVTALGNANYTLSGATGVEHEWKIAAASQAAPEVKIDFINETLSTDETMEFSADGETWQDCTAAMNVAKTGWNGSALTVKIRYKKDENHLDGEIQTLVIPARREAPDISKTTVSKSQTEIKIAEIAGCEYSLDGVIWQDSGSFSGLDEGETYEIHVRYKATSSAFASFVSQKSVVTSSTADGTTELLPGETVASGDGSITNYGDKIVIDDGEGNETTVTLPEGGSVEVDEQGCVTVPGGGEVAVGDNPPITLPEGGKVEPDGTVIADEVKVGDTDVKGEDVTVEPDGKITVPDEGSVKVGDNPEIILPTGGTVEPDGTVIADEVKIGNTDVKGEDVTVTPDGKITVPDEGSVKVGDNPEITLPTGGTVEPDGTVVADEVKVGDTDIKGEDVTVEPDGNITVPGEGTVKVGDNPEITLPTGGTVEPDGTVISDEVKVGDTDIKGEDVTVTPDGKITVPDEGSVKVGDNPEITLPTGGTVEPDGTVKADEVKIGNTDVKGEDVTVTPDGKITVPDEGSVKVGDNPEITLPAGGTVEPDGTVIADEIKVGNTDVKGEDVTVEPDGNITVPGEGTVKVGDNPEITLPTGGTVEPDGTVTADEVKVGNTDVKGEDVTVEPDGKITLPNGGSVAVEGEPEKIVPAGTTVENGKINAPAIAEPADGESLGDDIILKIESADERLGTADRENLKDVENAIAREVYDIELLKNGSEIQPNKLIKLTVLADVVGAKMKVFMFDNGKFTEIDAEFDAENGTFSVVTNSLGIFILASEEGQISAEVVASGDAPEVEISDDDRKALEENLFTDDDEAAIENGDNVKVVMNVEGVSEEDVPADDLAEIETFLDDLEDCEIAEYADITLTKITEDGVTGDEIRSEAIAEISNPIKLVFDIPEALHKVGRIFSVIRLHDGKAELLNDTDQSDETVTILTDKFSLYVLIYRDPKSQPSHVHSFTAWINVGAGGHLVRCAVCGEVMSLMPHTLLNGVCTACGYVLHGYLPDEGDVIEIEVPTEGRIAKEETVEF